MAVAASLQYYTGNIRVQGSGYSGGSVGLAPKQADSLKLKSGLFGTPVSLAEANIKYEYKGIVAKVLGTIISIPDAGDINRAYASNTPELLYGAYIEAAYNIFEAVKQIRQQKLFLFARYEKLDLNDRIPANGIIDKTLKQDHIIAGLTYMPVSNVVIKADMRFLKTGEENEALVINPSPVAPPYETNSSFLNIGLGYAF